MRLERMILWKSNPYWIEDSSRDSNIGEIVQECDGDPTRSRQLPMHECRPESLGPYEAQPPTALQDQRHRSKNKEVRVVVNRRHTSSIADPECHHFFPDKEQANIKALRSWTPMRPSIKVKSSCLRKPIDPIEELHLEKCSKNMSLCSMDEKVVL